MTPHTIKSCLVAKQQFFSATTENNEFRWFKVSQYKADITRQYKMTSVRYLIGVQLLQSVIRWPRLLSTFWPAMTTWPSWQLPQSSLLAYIGLTSYSTGQSDARKDVDNGGKTAASKTGRTDGRRRPFVGSTLLPTHKAWRGDLRYVRQGAAALACWLKAKRNDIRHGQPVVHWTARSVL